MAEELGVNRERISLKIDTETNWNNSAVTFIPYNGELLIYRNSTTDRPRLKVGDGATLPKNLPFFRDETGGGGGGSSSITTVNVTPGSGSISADGTTLTININSGSISSAGVVQLKNSIGNNESSTTTAATPKAVWDALQNYSYTLPLAANGTRGGIQIGFTTSATNRNYAVQLNNEKAYVNVPWTDTAYTFTTGNSAGQFKVTPSSGNAYNVNVKNVLVTDINNVNKIYVAASSGTNNTSYPGIMGYRQGATASTDSSWIVEGVVNDTSVRTAFAQKIKDNSNTSYEIFYLPPTTATFSSNSNQYIYTTKNVKAGSNISITRDGYDLTIAATGYVPLSGGTMTGQLNTPYLYITTGTEQHHPAIYLTTNDTGTENTALGGMFINIGGKPINYLTLAQWYGQQSSVNGTTQLIRADGAELYRLPNVSNLTSNKTYYLWTQKEVKAGTVSFAAEDWDSTTNTQSKTVTFATAMPSTAYVVILSILMNHEGAGGGGQQMLKNIRYAAVNRTTTGFTIWIARDTATGTAVNVHWMVMPARS